MLVITNAKSVIWILYSESTTRNGKSVIKLAKDAPAPIATNNAGKAQHIRVEEEANKDEKLAVLSFNIFIYW